MTLPHRVRLAAARVCAWLLWLSGWIGLSTLVQSHASGTSTGFALLALWVLATGASAEAVRRLRLAPGAARVALAVAALVTAWLARLPGGGDATLLALLLGWSATLALASAAVRACRPSPQAARGPSSNAASSVGTLPVGVPRVGAASTGQPPGPPIASGAAAAALAWWSLGDLTDAAAVHGRLASVLRATGLVLVLLWPRGAARSAGGCRAALFDCALPNWPAAAPERRQRWPMLLAGLGMLPMMCGLPLMLGLCRGAALGPRAALGLHLAAMFFPALCLAGCRTWALHRVARACAALLVAGAVAAVFAGGDGGDWALALAQGAAWSLAWAARLDRRGPRAQDAAPRSAEGRREAARPSGLGPASMRAPLTGAALNALLIVALGWALERYGLAALRGGQIGLGALAGAWLLLGARGVPSLAAVGPDAGARTAASGPRHRALGIRVSARARRPP